MDKCGQILKTVEENSSTSIRQLVRQFQVSQSKGCTPIMFSGYKHCNHTIPFVGKNFVSG
jgi:hypothetical protein